jgi:hypothetical protein
VPSVHSRAPPPPPLGAELYDLQDPEGVAQTTVSLLSEKAPERRLQEFLDHKIAGIRGVVDALQVGWELLRDDLGSVQESQATATAMRCQQSSTSQAATLWLISLVFPGMHTAVSEGYVDPVHPYCCCSPAQAYRWVWLGLPVQLLVHMRGFAFNNCSPDVPVQVMFLTTAYRTHVAASCCPAGDARACCHS